MFSKADLRKLQEKPLEYSGGRFRTRQSSTFYRDKPASYYDNIKYNHNGVMVPYIKDNNGDQKSPINGRIKGLFFSLQAQDPSFFGDTRFAVPAEAMLQGDKRIYFADFYCKVKGSGDPKPHYVTVVVTTRGTPTDRFCDSHLPELNIYNNPFLARSGNLASYMGGSVNGNRLHLEVLFTDKINMRHMINQGATLTPCSQQGTSRPGGIPKDSICQHCNIRQSPSIYEMGIPQRDLPRATIPRSMTSEEVTRSSWSYPTVPRSRSFQEESPHRFTSPSYNNYPWCAIL